MINWGPMSILLLLWGSALYLSITIGGASAWFLLYCFSGIAGYASLVLVGSLRKVHVESSIAPGRVYAGQDIEIHMTVTQHSWIPIAWIIVRDTWGRNEKSSLYEHRTLRFPWFRSTFTYQYVIRGVERGRYGFRKVEFSAGDLFGFAVKKVIVKIDEAFTVYANAMDMNRLMTWSAGPLRVEGVRWNRPGNGSLVSGIREYALGDPLNRIHWKSSARGGSLKTKLSEMESEQPIFIYVDGSGGSEEGFESCIRVAAGLLERAYHQKNGFGLACSGLIEGLAAYSAIGRYYEQAIELLAMASPQIQIESRADGIREQSTVEGPLAQWTELPRQVSLMWVTPYVGEALVDQVQSLRKRGRKLTVVRANSGPGIVKADELRRLKSIQRMGCGVTLVNDHTSSRCKKAGVEDDFAS